MQSNIFSLVNHLLRGLLASDPELRLTVNQALAMPVFDDYRGLYLPLEYQPKVVYKEQFGFTTLLLDEDLAARSFKSLEKKSVRVAPEDGSSEKSIEFSVRFEGEAKVEQQHPANMAWGGGVDLLQQQTSLESGFKKCRTQGRESLEMNSRISNDDFISPLASPQQNIRQIGKSEHREIGMRDVIGLPLVPSRESSMKEVFGNPQSKLLKYSKQ